ncbi:oligosaccharide flippase family protein [Bradyrhizobium sp. UFLA05-112]
MLAQASSSGIASQVAKAALQAGGTLLFARLLGPQEMGLFALVLPFVVFAQLFASAGLAQYLLHNPHILEERLDTLAAAAFCLSLLVAVLFSLVAIPLAQLLGLSIVAPMLATMSLVIVLESYCAFLRSLALRGQRYGLVAKVDIASAMIGLLIGLVQVGISPTAWALVSQSVATPLAATLMFTRYTEKLPRTFNIFLVTKLSQSLPGVISYAGWLVSFGLVNQMARNLDNVLIGWYWGPKLLGPYALGYRLLMLPLQVFNVPLSNVVLISLPTLSDQDRSEAYGRLARLSTFLGCSTILITNVNVSVFVDLALGPEWSALTSLFHILAISATFQSIVSLTGCLYQLTNHTRALFLISTVTSIITVMAFVLTISWGPIGIATTYSVLNGLFFLPLLFVATRYGRVSFQTSLRYCLPCLAVALMFVFLGTAVDQFMHDRALFMRILFGSTFGSGSALILALISFGTQSLRVRSTAEISKLVFG